MSVLLKKLSRTIWSTMGQYLAVTAVVAVGITVYIAMTTCYSNLNRSRDQFYRENNFADYYFHVVRAPEQVPGQIAALPGVAAVSGRIQKDVPLVKEGKQGSQRATARITSYPVPVEGVNRIQLLSGRMFAEYPPGGGVEVLVDNRFFKANRLSFNDTVNIVAGGRRIGTGALCRYPRRDCSSVKRPPANWGSKKGTW